MVIQSDVSKEKENVGRLEVNKEALNDRYNAMDHVVKAEFQRKDEAMANLQQHLENQLKAINSFIQNEEAARNQQEINLRMEINQM